MNDQINNPLSAFIQYGVSQDLLNMISALEEATAFDGSARFHKECIYELRTNLLCHNYGKTLWEVMHYVAAIQSLYPEGALAFFYEINSAQQFKAWSKNLAMGASEGGGDLNFSFPKRNFVLHANRINLVALWVEFLCEFDPQFMSRLITLETDLDAKTLDSKVKAQKQDLDRLLAPHIKAEHAQRQGKTMLAWLSEQYGSQENKAIEWVSDESVFLFWCSASLAETGDFKKFASVADCAFLLIRAIDFAESRAQVQHTQSYHQDAGGDDATWILDKAKNVYQFDDEGFEGAGSLFEDMIAERQDSPTQLLQAEPLNTVKFLTSSDMEFLQTFEIGHMARQHLALTAARKHHFGYHQARISQALRKSQGDAATDLLHCRDVPGLHTLLSDIESQLDKMMQTREAALHILFQLAEPGAISEIIGRLSDEQKTHIQAQAAQMDEPDAQRLIALLEQVGAEQLQGLEKVFAKVNRAGFKSVPEDDTQVLYVEGRSLLLALHQHISDYARYLKSHINQRQESSEDIQEKDRLLFSQQFERLYGAES